MSEAFIKKLPPVDPVVKSCIASILNNGGLYSLVNESISHEKVRGDKNQNQEEYNRWEL